MRLELLRNARDAWRKFGSTPAFRVRVLAAVVVLLSAVLLFRGLRQGMAFPGSGPNDFAAYHGAARAVLLGDLARAYHTERPYQYPPTLAVLIAPLGLLPAAAAAALWTLGSLAALLWTIRGAERALGPPISGVDKVMGLVLIFRMAESDFSNGNANTLILGLLLLGFSTARSGRVLAGGGLLGLAAALKVTPIILLPWMLLRRRFRMAGGFLLGLVLSGVVFPAVVLGPVPFGRAAGEFYRSTLSPLDAAGDGYREEAPEGYLAGQSLRALLHRLLRGIDATAHDRSAVRINVAEIPKGAVDALYLAAAAAVFLGLFLRFRKDGPEWSAGEIGAVLAAMVLLSPLSRKAHFVALFPAALAGFAVFRLACPGRRWIPGALWWGAFALSALTAPGLVGRAASRHLLAFCPLGLAAGLLMILCAGAGRTGRAPAG